MSRSTRPSKPAAIGPSGRGGTHARRRLGKRLRNEAIRSAPALVVAGDGDDHQLVGRELFLQLQQLFPHLSRIAVHQARALLLDVGALLQGVAVRPRFLERRHGRVDALRHVQAPKVDACGEALGLGTGLRADHEHAYERPGARLALRRPVLIAVVARYGFAPEPPDEMREREAQAELSGERTAVIRGAEQPYFRGRGPRGPGLDPDVRMNPRQRSLEKTD